jgi:hypothetical protein
MGLDCAVWRLKMDFVTHARSGLLLDQGQLGFFVQVIYFAWIAELIVLSSLRPPAQAHKPSRRALYALLPGAVSVAFLGYHLASGESLNLALTLAVIAAGVPLSLLLLATIRAVRSALASSGTL